MEITYKFDIVPITEQIIELYNRAISSEIVGWIATVLSKSFLVSPALTAIPNPYIISSAYFPPQWIPITFSSGSKVTSLKNDSLFTSS